MTAAAIGAAVPEFVLGDGIAVSIADAEQRQGTTRLVPLPRGTTRPDTDCGCSIARAHQPAGPSAEAPAVVGTHPQLLGPRGAARDVAQLSKVGSGNGDRLARRLHLPVDAEMSAARRAAAVPEFVLGDGIAVGIVHRKQRRGGHRLLQVQRAIAGTCNRGAALSEHRPAFPLAPVGAVSGAYPHRLRANLIASDVPEVREIRSAHGNRLARGLCYHVDAEMTAAAISAAVPELVLCDGIAVCIADAEQRRRSNRLVALHGGAHRADTDCGCSIARAHQPAGPSAEASAVVG